MSEVHRCGTVAIVGRPNVGKSTLLNRFLGEKIAIVSPKPETTRDSLLGILTLRETQLLFIDTPGIYRGPKTLLAKHQIRAATQALGEADLILLMTEAPAGVVEGDRQILRFFPRPEKIPIFLAINKVDRVKKERLLPQMEEFSRLYPFREIFPISARRGNNVEELLGALTKVLPAGPALYPPDEVTDQPVRQLARELIREKALIFTHEEVPHAVAVEIEEWRPGKGSPNTYIRATLYVERESQKGILIGKEGSLLKRIGEAARREIEELVPGKVYLDLWVKVAKDWRRNPRMLRQLGYTG